MGIGEVLFVVFLIMKLLDKIDWSWWAVTAPLWIPYLCVLPLFVLFYFVVTLITKGK